MNSKVSKHLIESLAASGIAIAGALEAYRQRRDTYWAVLTNAAQDFSDSKAQLDRFIDEIGALKFRARFAHAPAEWIPIAARSADALGKRLNWLTGHTVIELEQVERFAESPAPTQAPMPKPAADEIPSYPCAARAKAYEKLGAPDPLASAGTVFPTKQRPRF